MAEINTEIISNTIGLISFSDIKQLLEIDDDVADIFGNYEVFIKEQNNEELGHLGRIIKSIEKYGKEDRKYYNWLIIGKKGYFKYLKDASIYFCKYFYKRSDLNLLNRIRLSLMKTKNWVGRIKYVINIYKYLRYKDANDKEIKRLFDNNEISSIYLYRLRDDKILYDSLFEQKYKQ